MRCQCRACSTHSRNPCRRTRGELYRGRHPVAVHHFEGQMLCHLCLGRRLEVRLQRLYPDVIPFGCTVMADPNHFTQQGTLQ